MTDEVHAVLPEQPSRKSGRKYVWFIFALTGVEAVTAAITGYEHWAVLAAINVMPVLALLIAKASTTLDLNKWVGAATEMVKAKYGAEK